MCIGTQDVGESSRRSESEYTAHKVCAPECDRLECAHGGVYTGWVPLSSGLCKCVRLMHRTHVHTGAVVPRACWPPSLRVPLPRVGPGQARSISGAPGKGKGKGGGTHVAQVQDEAVTIVEALPGHGHLGGADHTPPFNLEESLHHYFIGHHMLES